MELSINGMDFTLVEVIVWLIVAAICGGIGEALVGYSPGGLFSSVAVGLLGAVLGTWLARQFGLSEVLTFEYAGARIDLLWSVVGAALLVFALSMVRRGPRRSSRRRYS